MKPKTIQELIEKLQNWNRRFNEINSVPKEDVKQKQFIRLSIPGLSFVMTNGHIDRGDGRDYKRAEFKIEFNLN